MTNAEHDKDMIESIEMWLHEIVPKWVEKELAWLDELRTRLLEEKSEIPNDLKEAAAEEYPCDKWMTDSMLDLNAHKQVAFWKGAKWQKEQMMKEAVESTVTTNLANRPIIYYDQLQGFKYGDKVKIIIVKED